LPVSTSSPVQIISMRILTPQPMVIPGMPKGQARNL
jgi:hypothetical protein